MATQYFNLLLNLYREGKKILLVCFLLPLKRDKNVWHLQPISSVWRPLAFLHVTLSSSWSLFELMSIEVVMPSNHLILFHPLLLLPSIFLSMRVFSNESVLCIRWPKYWSFSFNITLSSEHYDWFPLRWTGWISLQSKGLSRVFSNTTVQKHQFFSTQLSL